MTKSVTIVNTSNWEGENVKVTVGDMEPVIIKPGAQVQLSSGDYDGVKIEDAEQGESSPFQMNGQQVFPFVETGFRG